jgi:glycosyltransferase involved in cell wall biosynthesis
MKLSIVTINYNNAIGLERTIKSIVSQNYTDFEYLVIDGFSSDNSVNIIKQQADKITYWISEPDSGIYSAMNKGIRQAKGDYVLFINSGDYLAEDADLSAIMKHVEDEDLVYFDLYLQYKTGIISTKEYPKLLSFKYFLEDTLPHPATFIKRELFLKFGLYDERMKICSDWAFFIRAICLEHCSYKYVDNSFSVFCMDGLSSDEANEQLILDEKKAYLQQDFGVYMSLIQEYKKQKIELNTLYRRILIRILIRLKLIGRVK